MAAARTLQFGTERASGEKVLKEQTQVIAHSCRREEHPGQEQRSFSRVFYMGHGQLRQKTTESHGEEKSQYGGKVLG